MPARSTVDRTVFPFTRMLTGTMDYTPGGFSNVAEESFVALDKNPMIMGTCAQQLVLYVVFQAGFEMVSEIYTDATDSGDSPKYISIRKQTVRGSDVLSLSIAKGGGCAMQFVPIN